MSELNRQMATSDRGLVAFDDRLETKDKEAKKHSMEEEEEAIGCPVEKEESRMGISEEEDRSLVKKEENRRKSSDFWLLWPQPSTRASMARFALLLSPPFYKNQINCNMAERTQWVLPTHC